MATSWRDGTSSRSGSAPPFSDVADEEDLLDTSNLPLNATVEPYAADGFTGQRAIVAVDDMARAGDLLAELDATSDLLEGFLLTREDDSWRFEMNAPPFTDAIGEIGADASVVTLLTERASYVVKVTLPGAITEHNADRLEGNALAWDLDFTSTEPRTLSARSSLDGGLNTGIAVAVAAMLAVALVVAAGARMAARRR